MDYSYGMSDKESSMTINLKSNIQAIIKSISILHTIAHSEAAWLTKFELVCGQLDSVNGALGGIGVALVWNDPDGDYEADTMAIIQALDEIAEELAIVLEAMP